MTKSSTSSRRVWLWSYAPLVLWLAVIFALSSPGGSSANTSLIIGPMLNFFFPDMSEASRNLVHACVRKTAHFTEYAILALLAVRAFRSLANWRWLLAIALVVVVAMLDEFNQSFEASRTGSPYDTLLDIAGGAAGLLISYAAFRRRSRVKS